jgi:hypothetical protein
MRPFHRHIDKVVKIETQPSPWEQCAAAGMTKLDSLEVSQQFWRQWVIVTYRCETCGREKVERV